MAEEKKQEKFEKKQKEEKSRKESKREEEKQEILVRISGYDIPGSKNIYVGLTRIKGISWAISNAVCVKLGISRNLKASELTKDKILEIENFLSTLQIPEFMKNRRFDEESGKTAHLLGSDLDIKKDFDIKKMKKIKSYKGIRHTMKQPTRGQRTRSHFRQRGAAIGVQKGKAAAAAKSKEAKK